MKFTMSRLVLAMAAYVAPASFANGIDRGGSPGPMQQIVQDVSRDPTFIRVQGDLLAQGFQQSESTVPTLLSSKCDFSDAPARCVEKYLINFTFTKFVTTATRRGLHVSGGMSTEVVASFVIVDNYAPRNIVRVLNQVELGSLIQLLDSFR